MGFVKKALKKALNIGTFGLFGEDEKELKLPDIPTPARAVENTKEDPDIALGSEQSRKKKKRGKASLKVKLNQGANTGGGGTGLNIGS